MKTTVVMVVYKQKLEQSRTFQTIRRTFFTGGRLRDEVHVIIYDNSPEPQSVPREYADAFTYKHDPRNLGIAVAYNYAWQAAKQHNSEWLILLDHDTELTQAYADAVLSLEKVDRDQTAAIVPKVICNEVMISPVFSDTLQPLKAVRPETGIQQRPIMAINSGAAVNMQFLNQLGGFNEEFPLDFLDHWLFYEVYERGYKSFVLDVTLENELSVMNYDTVSLQRYKSILGSEIHFYKNYKKGLLKRYKRQLLLRTVKQLVFVRNKSIAFHTLRQLLTV
jgi:GT2 family glycosyltransferase